MYNLRIILFFASVITFEDVKTLENNDYVDDEDIIFAFNWPEKYMVYAEIINLNSGIVENVQAWKSNDKSRIDYNGVVRRIIRDNIRYTMEPQADINMHSTNSCVWTNLSSTQDDKSNKVLLDTVLPTGYFAKPEKDTINGIRTFKLSRRSTDGVYDVIEYFWVKTEKVNKTLIPVRYEILIYKDWLGNLFDHEIKHYFSLYQNEFDDSVFLNDVLTTDQCEEKRPEDDTKYLRSLKYLNPHNPTHVDLAFDEFKKKYNKVYSDQNEHSMRRRIFQETMTRVITKNNQNIGYTLGINKFADMTNQEKAKYRGLVIRESTSNQGTIPFPYTHLELEDIADTLPKEYDLRLLGLITPVKNQGSCGSCWSFGTTSAAEGALARSNGGRLIRLSQQALLDCTWSYGTHGCDGGHAIEAFKWMMHFGIPTEEEYGIYTSQDGICHIKDMQKLYKLRGFTDVTSYSNTAVKIAIINHGPLVVAFHATDNFQSYSGGIFYDENCSSNSSMFNHEVSLVGYGEQDGAGFWIIQNSWGLEWGVEGYMFVSMDRPCGITANAKYAVF